MVYISRNVAALFKEIQMKALLIFLAVVVGVPLLALFTQLVSIFFGVEFFTTAKFIAVVVCLGVLYFTTWLTTPGGRSAFLGGL